MTKVVGRHLVALGGCIAIIVVFLHNPFSGWQYETNYSRFSNPTRPCTQKEQDSFRLQFESNRTVDGSPIWSTGDIQKLVASCTQPVTYYLPLDQWTSNEPHVEWFGKVMNVISLLSAIVLMLAAIYYLYGTSKKAK